MYDVTIPVTSIYSNWSAFAALRSDGSVVTGGAYDFGEDSSEVANEIDGDIDATQVFAIDNGFLVKRSDGKLFLVDQTSYKRRF